MEETSLPIGILLPNKPKHSLVPRQATRKGKSDSQGLQGSSPAQRHRKKPLGGKSLPLFRNSPVNSGVDGAILSRKEKPMRWGESSRKAEPGPYTSPQAHGLRVAVSAAASLPANSLPVLERARAAPAPRFAERGRAGLRCHPPSSSLSGAGGVRTSAGRGLSSADVGSRTRTSSRLPAALSGGWLLAPRP